MSNQFYEECFKNKSRIFFKYCVNRIITCYSAKHEYLFIDLIILVFIDDMKSIIVVFSVYLFIYFTILGIRLTLSAMVDGRSFNQGGHKLGLGLDLEA